MIVASNSAFMNLLRSSLSLVGTGAWESALTNTLSPGDKIISFRLGQFSLLWIDQQQRLGFDVDAVDLEWGAGIDLDFLKQKLLEDKSHAVKALCVVHNETSTGVTNDIAGRQKNTRQVH